MVQQNRSSAFTATVSSLIQKLPINTYSKLIRYLQLHEPKITNANHLKHLLFVVQCKPTETNGDHDFLQFMVDRKQIIDEIIEETVQAEAKKVQLSAKIKLEKPALEDEGAPDLTIRLNSKMKTVYLGEKLTEDAFFYNVGWNFIESVQFCFPRKWVDAQRYQWSLS